LRYWDVAFCLCQLNRATFFIHESLPVSSFVAGLKSELVEQLGCDKVTFDEFSEFVLDLLSTNIIKCSKVTFCDSTPVSAFNASRWQDIKLPKHISNLLALHLTGSC
jgi:hypothetical protein